MNSFNGKVIPTSDLGVDKGEIWCLLLITPKKDLDLYAYVSCTSIEGLDMKGFTVEFMDIGWESMPYAYDQDMFEEIENVSWAILTEMLDNKTVGSVV
jgi:hypothetical protein